MIRTENECVGCPPEMGCMGSACPNREVPHYFCDDCDEEFDPSELFDVDGEMLCQDCLLKGFERISV